MQIREEHAEDLLVELLGAHEGGAPSVDIGYDEATHKYVASQNREYGNRSSREHGYGRGVLSALLDLIEAQTARREGREKKWAEDI